MAARRDGRIFFAGQLAGTEGYIENIASGLVAGLNAARLLEGQPPLRFPEETAIGALCRYVSTPQKEFSPTNISFGLLPPVDAGKRVSKQDKQRLAAERALDALARFAGEEIRPIPNSQSPLTIRGARTPGTRRSPSDRMGIGDWELGIGRISRFFLLPVFEPSLDVGHELVGGGAVDDPMIERQ
jgi:hypothetical protein